MNWLKSLGVTILVLVGISLAGNYPLVGAIFGLGLVWMLVHFVMDLCKDL